MALSRIPKDRTVAGLVEIWSAIDALIADLRAEDWKRPAPLPGWDVQALISHIIGTESLMLGLEGPPAVDPESYEHVRNQIGAFNEAWVVALRGESPEAMVARFRELTARRLEALRELPQEEWDAESFTPAGPDSYGRFVQIRVFDCWMHDQDARVALGLPIGAGGAPAEISLDEIERALGFVVGKRAGVPAGSSVTFDLTGDGARTIHVEVGERAHVVPELDGPATTTLTMPAISLTRIAGGRDDAPAHEQQVTISGDDEVGRRVLANLSYMI